MAFAVGTLLVGNGQQYKIAIGVLGLIGLITKTFGRENIKTVYLPPVHECYSC